MTAHAPVRVPFAPLDNPRLQHLASAKNRQNGFSALHSASGGKRKNTPLSPSNKRPLDLAIFDDDAQADAENIDPAVFDSPSKKSKSGAAAECDFAPVKPFTFSCTPPVSNSGSMPPPSITPSRFSTPAKTDMSSPRRGALTAPAGRSPTKRHHKSLGTPSIHKSRRTSAPFSRIDPPSGLFGFNTTSGSSALPFSLDAALNGTLDSSSSTAAQRDNTKQPLPKSWFFEIYTDTPDEEAATLMEHSTLTLDICSDDESTVKERSDRGKENMPPEGYEAAAASRPASAELNGITTEGKEVLPSLSRRKKVDVDDMDDGLRAPLAELETGSDEVQTDSVIVVGQEGDLKGEIVVWDDAAVGAEDAPAAAGVERVEKTQG